MSRKMYSYEEVYNETLKYFEGDSLPTDVISKKYYLVDNEGNYLEKSPSDMWRRLTKEFARIEKKYPNPMNEEEIYELLKDFKYVVPQGSILSGVGNDYQIQSLSNCYTIESPCDSYGGILKADQEIVKVSKRRGGVGLDIGNLRPKGEITRNCAKTTDGIEVFLERFSNSTREVAQSGRRGSLMLTIPCNHPQIEDFINIKRNKSKVTGANISIRISDEFMKAVENNEEYELKWPVDSDNPKVTKKINARDLWDKICESNRTSAEPGILFWDRILEGEADCYSEFRSVSTNPSLRGNTLVYTPGRGFRKIKELADVGNILVQNIEGETKEAIAFKSGNNKQLYKILIQHTSGRISEIYCTKEHKWPVFLNGKMSTKKTIDIDREVGYCILSPIKEMGHDITPINAEYIKIIGVEETDIYEDVYDITVFDDTHTFLTDFGYSGNCSELPLNSYSSCKLMVLNVFSYVENKFSNPSFNFKKFVKDAKAATRLLDDVTDLEVEHIDKILQKINSDPESEEVKFVEKKLWERIREKCIAERRLGLGTTAIGDAVAGMNMKYGSEESIQFVEQVMKTLHLSALESSIDMAEERGHFPNWDYEQEKDWPFIKKCVDELNQEYQEKYKQFGKRNVALTTISPGGCLKFDTKIETNRGCLSLKQIFELNGVFLEDLLNTRDLWFDSIESLYVYDVKREKHKINKIYWNGFDKCISLKFNDNTDIVGTKEHKLLVLSSDEKFGVWKPFDEITDKDKIIKIL